MWLGCNQLLGVSLVVLYKQKTAYEMRISDWSSDVCSSDLLLIAGDQAYRFECDFEIAPGGTAGLILFYDEKLYCGLGFDGARLVTHHYRIERARPANPHGLKLRLGSEGHTSELQSLMRRQPPRFG